MNDVCLKDKRLENPILLVDDEEQILFSVDATLRMAGMSRTMKCSDSRKVESLLRENTFSALLLDLSMPHVSGCEILAHVTDNYPELPVIIVTAVNELETLAECLDMGAYDYLVKPVDKNRLLTSVRRALEYRDVRTENRLMKDLLLSDRFDMLPGEKRSGGASGSLRVLQKTREEYRSLFDNMLVPSFVLDAKDHTVMYCNRALAEFSSYPDSKSLVEAEVNFLDCIEEGERSALLAELTEKGKFEGREFSGRRRNGSGFSILLSCRLLPEEGYIEGSFIDITKRKVLKEQFRQAQKMEAVGRLAGGVAHDFNNILTAIVGYTEMITMEPDTENIDDCTKQIFKASQKASSLIRQLLAFSRSQKVQTERIDLNDLINDLEKMLSMLVGGNILLEVHLDPVLGPIVADSSQIQQVIMNLVVNARDAMSERGVITLETRKVDIDADHVRAHKEIEPGLFAMIVVSDTGHGMQKETLDRIFEPFFTTKESGKGTGLGLSTVFGITEGSGGFIEVESAVNNGTTFKVYLPLAESCAATVN